MHELAIAQNIVEIIQQSVPKTQVSAVKVVNMKVGKLAGVVPDSLEFCFTAIVSDTELQGARLHIEQVSTEGRCKDCKHHFILEDYVFLCPACKSTNIALVSGTELEITDIEVSDEPIEAV
jgi:hydrogenase nickel incorporation protein HypA/HybF